MSSMRNAVQRRNHKERAQPLERQKWGLLEKHSDYSKRAADHNTKKRKLRALQTKASERNEDEFAFGMMSASTAGGVKRAKRGAENAGGSSGSMSEEVIRLMKTQDVGYLRTVLQTTRKEREKLDREVVAAEVGDGKPGKKIVFDEDGEEIVQDFDDDDSLADLDGLDDDSDSEKEEVKDTSEKGKALYVKRRKLEGLEDREAQLTQALQQVEDQRARMNGSMAGMNKKGVTFKPRQRKR